MTAPLMPSILSGQGFSFSVDLRCLFRHFRVIGLEIPPSQRDDLQTMIEGYILGRPQMTNLFVLIDSRHAPMKIDLEFFNWLGENGVPFSIVFTKLDKLGPEAGKRNVRQYCNKLLETWEELPPVFLTSSEDGRGREQLLDYIEQLNRLPIEEE